MNKILYPELSKDVLDAFYEVCRGLEAGYAEKVYGKALAWELRQLGHKVEEQMPLTVMYKGVDVGDFVPDLYVDDMMILELKAVKDIEPEHIAQLINYLAATNSKVGYVLNFGRHRCFERRLGPSALHDMR